MAQAETSSEASQRESEFTDSSALGVLTAFTGFFAIILAVILAIESLIMESDISKLGKATELGGELASAMALPITELLMLLDDFAFFGTIVLAFVLAAAFNDILIGKTGKKAVLYSALAIGLVGPAAFMLGAPPQLYMPAVAVAICLFVLIWGTILSNLNSRTIVSILMLASVFSGIFVLLTNSINQPQSFGLIALTFFVSWISAYRLTRDSLPRVVFASRRQSIERHVSGKGNRFTLMLVGAMFGMSAVLILYIELPTEQLALTLGLCMLAAGSVIIFFYRNLHSGLGDVLKRILSLTLVIGLLPFPFLPPAGQLACICFLFIAGTVNLILIIDSILETSRFNQISPFWIIGCEGAEFFASAFVVMLIASFLIFLNENGLLAMVFSLSCASTVLQIYINNQSYPLFMPQRQSSESSGVTVDKTDKADEEYGQAAMDASSAHWRSRIDSISAQYRLSLRQKETMEILVKGRDLSYIMTCFKISRSTAKTHISNLYRKMNVHSKQELIDLMEMDDAKRLGYQERSK